MQHGAEEVGRQADHLVLLRVTCSSRQGKEKGLFWPLQAEMVMSIVEGEMGGKGGVVVADDLCIRSTESTDSCTGDFESHSTSPFVSDDHPLEMNHHRCSCPHHPPSRRGCGPQTLPSTLPPSDRCPPAPPSTTDKVRCRRRLSPFLRVPRASLAFLVFVSCLGVNLARPTSRHQGLSSQRQHYRDSQSRAMVSTVRRGMHVQVGPCVALIGLRTISRAGEEEGSGSRRLWGWGWGWGCSTVVHK